jgi:hypothetical protein
MSPDVELALRKQRLLLRSTALRREFAGHVAGAAPAIAFGNRLAAGAQWLKRHPLVLVAAAGALLVRRPHGVMRWARRGFAAWQALRHARAWVARFHSVP